MCVCVCFHLNTHQLGVKELLSRRGDANLLDVQPEKLVPSAGEKI